MARRLRTFAAVAVLATAHPAAAFDWSAEVYGGLALARVEAFAGNDYDIDQGSTLGFGIYANGVISELAVGLDMMTTRAVYAGSDDLLETVSLMAVLRKDFPIGQTVEGYVSGGLGVIHINLVDDPDTSSDNVTGAQVAIGLRRSLGPTTRMFGEVKYQTALQDAYPIFGDTQSYASTNVLLGLEFGF